MKNIWKGLLKFIGILLFRRIELEELPNNLDEFGVQKVHERFKHLLDCRKNTTIWLSGSYGSGKSYILKNFQSKFFEEYSISYIDLSKAFILNDSILDILTTQLCGCVDLGTDVISAMAADTQFTLSAGIISISKSFKNKTKAAEELNRASQRVVKHKRKVVLLIDELDRIDTGMIPKVLSTILNLCKLDNLYVIIAVNPDILYSIYTECLGTSDVAEEHVRKFFDFVVRRPKLTEESKKRFLDDYMRRIKEAQDIRITKLKEREEKLKFEKRELTLEFKEDTFKALDYIYNVLKKIIDGVKLRDLNQFTFRIIDTFINTSTDTLIWGFVSCWLIYFDLFDSNMSRVLRAKDFDGFYAEMTKLYNDSEEASPNHLALLEAYCLFSMRAEGNSMRRFPENKIPNQYLETENVSEKEKFRKERVVQLIEYFNKPNMHGFTIPKNLFELIIGEE
jgi:polyhydroxyalkanoate synthesis regulator phasin